MNHNIAPYNDDFDSLRNYLKILFKPSMAVQARELNQIQSILQNQIGKIGNHLFNNGAKISGCSTSFIQYDYVRVMEDFHEVPIKLSPYSSSDYKLIGSVSEVEATIIRADDKNDDTPIVYVTYTKTGADGVQSTFIPGEDVLVYDKNNVNVYAFTVRCPGCPDSVLTDTVDPLGKSMFFNIDKGIFYYNGYFVENESQKIIIEKYLKKDVNGQVISNKTYRVGLDVIEEIITAEDDESLYDPHLGHPNFTAPGADRYKLSFVLSLKDYVDNTDDAFIMLAKVRQNHTVEYQKDSTEYGEIMNELARRTHETSGDFTVNPFTARFLNEHAKVEADPVGWSETGDKDNLVAILSPGIAYVKGYRVENISDSIVSFPKARDTRKVRGASMYVSPRTYITVTIPVGQNLAWINHTGSSVLSDQIFNLVDSAGTSIGTFKIYDALRQSGNVYQLFIYDLSFTASKKLNEAVSVKLGQSFTAPLYEGFNINESNESGLIFKINQGNVKSLRDYDNALNGNTIVEYRKKLAGLLDINGSITFNAGTNESFAALNNINVLCWVDNYPDGKNVEITIANSVFSGTTITLNLGPSNANKSVNLLTNVIKTNQTENVKSLASHTLTTSAAPEGAVNSIIKLPYCDGYKLDSVKLISISDQTLNLDITDEYEFDNGQTDNFYTECKIKRLAPRTFGNDNRIIIKFYYFEHSGNAGFFTSNSYDQLVNDEATDISYEDIPVYKSTKGIEYRLAECMDFRTIKLDNNVNNGTQFPAMYSTSTFDLEYYLPRSDLLMLSKDGDFYVKQGQSNEDPILPKPDPDSLVLYHIFLKPYVYTLNDVNTRYIDSRRFRMKDLAGIETRLANLEYYTSLNALESQTVNMSIKDTDGFDRFKNGLIVDNFKNYYAADLSHKEFKAALDRVEGELRPQFKTHSSKLAIDIAKSSNLKTIGNVGMIGYRHDLFLGSEYATKAISINPYLVYRTTGSVVLSPNIDTWADENYLPTIVTNIDTGVDALRAVADAAGVLGTDYSSWVDFNRGIQQASETIEDVAANTRTVSTITTTTTESARTATTKSINSKSQSYSINDVVKDVQIIPYIRPQIITFYSTNLKPNTKFYVYFDGQDVSKHCKPLAQVGAGDVLVDRSASVFGAVQLITDADGNFTGQFRIPENTFFTGEKSFVITNDKNNTGNPDLETIRAETKYFAGGLSTTKQNTTMNIITPTYNTNTSNETRSTTSVSRQVNSVSVLVPPPIVEDLREGSTIGSQTSGVWLSGRWWSSRGSWWSMDPVAQGFKVDSSCFISKVGVYFENVDMNNDMIWIELREMTNGYPTKSALSRKEYKPNEVISHVSTDGSKEFVCEFDVPVYVSSEKSYALVVGGYSPETRLFVGRLGERLVNKDKVLDQHTTTYTMFRSLNGETWNAEQFEVMKHNIYRCYFDTDTLKLELYNKDYSTVRAEDRAIEVKAGSNRVRVYAKNHGFRDNDKCTISFGEQLRFRIKVESGMPQIDQPISTITGSGYIKDIKITDVLNEYEVLITRQKGYFLKDQEFVCEMRSFVYYDLFIATSLGANKSIIYNESLGFFLNGTNEVLQDNLIGTVPIYNLAGDHIVKSVDSIDSFIIEVAENFIVSGRYGNDYTFINDTNIQYNMFNISGGYLSYDCTESWTAKQYKVSGEFSNLVQFKPSNDTYLSEPHIILSNTNEKNILGNVHSNTVLVEFKSKSPYISPVLNLDSFSSVLVSNRVESIDLAKYNSEPNTTRFVPETHPTDGSESYKYVTQRVLLKKSALDLRILLDVYCEQEADFDIYIKTLTAYDSNNDDNVGWVLCDKYSKNKFSAGYTDFIEYDIQGSTSATNWVNEEFISFRIKLVGRSTNSSKPPIFKNLRAIAVT